MSFNHQGHRELWDWLSKHPGKLKSEWPGWDRNYGPYPDNGNECFACDACSDCSGCPLVWPNGHCYERFVEGKTLNGLFKRWHVLNEISRNRYNRGFFDSAWESIPEMIQLARRIRDLPLAQHSDQEDNTIFFDDCEPGDLEPSLEPDDDAAYDRRVDDMLCGDDNDNIIQWFEED